MAYGNLSLARQLSGQVPQSEWPDGDIIALMAHVDAQIDAALRDRYPTDVPFTTTPALVASISTELAASTILMSRAEGEETEYRQRGSELYKLANARLDSLRDGRLDLGLASEDTPRFKSNYYDPETGEGSDPIFNLTGVTPVFPSSHISPTGLAKTTIVSRPADMPDWQLVGVADGETSDVAAELAKVDAAAVANGRQVYLGKRDLKVATNLTLNARWIFDESALTVDGVTLTFAKLPRAVDAKIFDVTNGGAVRVNQSGRIPIDWFTAGGTSDDTVGHNAWLDCVLASKSVGVLKGKTYTITGYAKTGFTNAQIYGLPGSVVKLKDASNSTLYRLTQGQDLIAEGFEMDGNRANQSAGAYMCLDVDECTQVHLRALRTHSAKQHGIRLERVRWFAGSDLRSYGNGTRARG